MWGGGGRLLVSSVPMLEQKKKKTMRKGIFIKLESAHHLGYENAFFFTEKAHVFHSYAKTL